MIKGKVTLIKISQLKDRNKENNQRKQRMTKKVTLAMIPRKHQRYKREKSGEDKLELKDRAVSTE